MLLSSRGRSFAAVAVLCLAATSSPAAGSPATPPSPMVAAPTFRAPRFEIPRHAPEPTPTHLARVTPTRSRTTAEAPRYGETSDAPMG